jgi:hypothetical protein
MMGEARRRRMSAVQSSTRSRNALQAARDRADAFRNGRAPSSSPPTDVDAVDASSNVLLGVRPLRQEQRVRVDGVREERIVFGVFGPDGRPFAHALQDGSGTIATLATEWVAVGRSILVV